MGSTPLADSPALLNPRIETIRARLAEIEEERQRLLVELERLSTARPSHGGPLGAPALESAPGNLEERIALFMRLFCCRTDVFPKLWESRKKGTMGYSPVCKVEWIRGRCGKPAVKCGDCRNQAFLPLDESVIGNHLQGNVTIGTYTILEGDTCIFIAADFDKEHWDVDAMTYKAAAKDMGVEVYVERSRSGRGGHVWIFFEAPIPAVLARRLGTLILSRAMTRRHNIEFDSYDRFYPSQDTLPKGGFGSLIALPLQGIPSRTGNSVFIDDKFEPYPDQWDLLRSVRLLSLADVTAVLDEHSSRPAAKDGTEPVEPGLVEAETSIGPVEDGIRGAYSGAIPFSLSGHLEIAIAGLPSRLVTAFKRAATFANPKFFELQRMRFSTWNTPRYICCAELSDDGNRMMLPRGLVSRCMDIARLAGGRPELSDRRPVPAAIPIGFTGELQPPQKAALERLLSEESGVLVAPPGAGKTVIACALIAERKLPTLILVHRKQLADQWRKQLIQFTDLAENQIGGPGRKSGATKDPQEPPLPGSFADIAMLQTLSRDDPDSTLDRYGQIVVDECHHVPAVSFEGVLKRIEARHFLGLTATPYRKDGLEKMIAMQCGPVLHTMGESKAQMLIARTVIVRVTNFRMGGRDADVQPALHEVWQALTTDRERLRLVASDVMAALREGRFPLVLSDRKEHLEALLAEIDALVDGEGARGFLITSDTGKRLRNRIFDEVGAMRERGESAFLLSTGSLIGEGFDLPELCTLVLAMPLSFKGRLVQYAGRLHRESAGKNDVRIYDYVDVGLGLGVTMFRKRLVAYRKMGYDIELPQDPHLKDLAGRRTRTKPPAS